MTGNRITSYHCQKTHTYHLDGRAQIVNPSATAALPGAGWLGLLCFIEFGSPASTHTPKVTWPAIRHGEADHLVSACLADALDRTNDKLPSMPSLWHRELHSRTGSALEHLSREDEHIRLNGEGVLDFETIHGDTAQQRR